MEINLIKVDGKPVEKLLEVISSAIGTVSHPWVTKRNAIAEAEKITLIEAAKTKALIEGNEAEIESYLRIKERIIHCEAQRQNNLDNVNRIAAQQLSQESEVSDEPVNADWASRFFKIVEEVSDDEMQKLWGRILAGEVKKPKSFSLRTLELLRNLSQEEAEVFTKFAQFSIGDFRKKFIAGNIKRYKGQDFFGLDYGECLLLEELGLILPNELGFALGGEGFLSKSIIGEYGGRYLEILCDEMPEFTLPVIAFTRIGCELIPLIQAEYHHQYMVHLRSLLPPGAKLKVGKISNRSENAFNIDEMEEFK